MKKKTYQKPMVAKAAILLSRVTAVSVETLEEAS